MCLPNRWSHSTLSLYETCPAAAAAKWSGEPAVVGDNVTQGQLLHEAIARYAVACWEAGRTRMQEAAESIALGYPGHVAPGLKSFAEDMRWPWKAAASSSDACPVEQMWEARLPGGDTFVGRLDLAYTQRGAMADNPFADAADLTVIADWKLHRFGDWDGAEVPTQLLRYAWLYQQNRPEAKEFHLLFGAPGWQGQWRMKSWRIGGDLSYVGAGLQALVDRIAADTELRPRPGPDSCPRCFYRAACPLRGTDTLAVLCDAPAENLAQAVAWHEAQGKLAKDVLKGRAEAAGGRLEVGDVTWGWTEKTSLVPVDMFSLREVCDRAGHDYTELLGGYDKRKVTKAQKDGWLPEDLFEAKTVGRVFGPLKGGNDANE